MILSVGQAKVTGEIRSDGGEVEALRACSRYSLFDDLDASDRILVRVRARDELTFLRSDAGSACWKVGISRTGTKAAVGLTAHEIGESELRIWCGLGNCAI